MNVRIFWVRAMKCMYAQTRPRFILSSEGVLGEMEFEPMLTPREKSPIPENVPRGGLNPRRCGQRAQALPAELFRPPSCVSIVEGWWDVTYRTLTCEWFKMCTCKWKAEDGHIHCFQDHVLYMWCKGSLACFPSKHLPPMLHRGFECVCMQDSSWSSQ